MHGGNPEKVASELGIDPAGLYDVSACINPLGFPAWTRQLVSRNVSQLSRYPDPDYPDLKAAAAGAWSVDPGQISAGNGSSELLQAVLRARYHRGSSGELIIPVPAYIDYERYADALEIPTRFVNLPDKADFSPCDTEFISELSAVIRKAPGGSAVILANPVNPVGSCYRRRDILALVSLRMDVMIIIDEAYLEFVGEGVEDAAQVLPAPEQTPNLVRIKSLTKIYAVPGIRLGFCIAAAYFIRRVDRQLPSWNVGSLAAALGQRLLTDSGHREESRSFITGQRELLSAALGRAEGIRLIPSQANFLLFSVDQSDDEPPGDRFYSFMIKRGILLRRCDDYRNLGPHWFRLGISTKDVNRQVIHALGQWSASTASMKTCGPNHQVNGSEFAIRRVSAIMFQGTGSNAGKSLMTAAFLRCLKRRGIRCAPFKAQNMSLNSMVTLDGGEIGRAQALQARAAGIEPRVEMNPVLLKPNSETGSQVVVLGKPWRNFEASDYYNQKDRLRQTVFQAYDRLAGDYDFIVLEGAGSPGEVNLKRADIVNMAMARHACSPVVLVGDIDRGGVYASFIGHMEVMEEWERELTAGFLVNRFRGDESLLADAHEYLHESTGLPVLGIMPYVPDHRLPEEDGVDFDLRYRREVGASATAAARPADGQDVDGGNTTLRIAVIALRHISNSTDIDPLLAVNNLDLRLFVNGSELVDFDPHLIIIPGSKNVIADYRILESSGVSAAISRQALSGRTAILGICGGFQMLGNHIADPLGVETDPGETCTAMGLLPVSTILQEGKTTVRRRTRLSDGGAAIEGYEIHHGKSEYSDSLELFDDPGLGARQQSIWGTYLHGVLENRSFLNDLISSARALRPDDFPARSLLNSLARNEPDEPKGQPGPDAAVRSLEAALDRFSLIFEEHVDVDELISISGYRGDQS
ncbi:cobyric acid synthase [Salinispira pacifica]|uniref:Cobyric acid synthase n=1 Tax=Salinispira pacifica TaxID=1307761 RepID=V5WI07_9SPIO|nr:cobyric acid synthase [Salinispira pacifica]AHC15428.1 Cobyric acid synthase [Salinispira pacifica]